MTNDDKKVVMYLVNRKIAMNMELVKLYSDKAEYPNFPTKKVFAQNDQMRRIRKLFLNGFITFDETIKAISNDSIDDVFYQLFK